MNMKDTRHTPGPWYAEDAHGRTVAIFTSSRTENAFVASVPPPASAVGGTWAETDANARLIAAAPELLATLETLAGRFAVDHSQPDNCDCYCAARAAIAKAKGGA